MLKIIKIENYVDIHYYVILLENDFHNLFISFLNELGFNSGEISKVDTPFFNLEGEYLPLLKENMRIHLFIEKEKVNMVIDTKFPQGRLNEILKKHFSFPKN